MQVRLAALGGETELFLEFLTSYASLEDAMELFCVDVEWRFFCGRARGS